MHEDPIPALKRQMAETIAAITQNWSLGDAAAVMTTDRWRVADIRAGRLQRFSLETLIRFANNLGYDTAIQTERRKLRVASKTERATGSPQR